MSVPEKLKEIQRLTRLSQEKMARQLGVSFATFNSWINGRSRPREKARLRIHEWYLDITGQRVIPEKELNAKKDQLLQKSNEESNILQIILDNPDIYDQFMLSLTYNTNRIEGSTLTEPETAAILFQNSVLPDKSLVEHLEVKNHQTALRYLLEYLLKPPADLDEALIITLHRLLMNSIRPDAGSYRRHSVRIVGADVPTANYAKVPLLMKELNSKLSTPQPDIIRHIAYIHSRFEQIHPFSDGNGRIGRLLIHAMALKHNLPPAVIVQEKKQFYYTYLNKAQLTQYNDLSLLENFICDALLDGFKFLERDYKNRSTGT